MKTKKAEFKNAKVTWEEYVDACGMEGEDPDRKAFNKKQFSKAILWCIQHMVRIENELARMWKVENPSEEFYFRRDKLTYPERDRLALTGKYTPALVGKLVPDFSDGYVNIDLCTAILNATEDELKVIRYFLNQEQRSRKAVDWYYLPPSKEEKDTKAKAAHA